MINIIVFVVQGGPPEPFWQSALLAFAPAVITVLSSAVAVVRAVDKR
jgi:hypothetical protein